MQFYTMPYKRAILLSLRRIWVHRKGKKIGLTIWSIKYMSSIVQGTCTYINLYTKGCLLKSYGIGIVLF